ncbi:MAG: aminopeptidase [Nanoarchaeota archaeon]
MNKKDMIDTVKNVLDNFIKINSRDKILLVKDKEKDSITEVFIEELKDRNSVFKEVRITADRGHSSPIPEIAAELMWADVTIAPTTKSITHCPETKRAEEKGSRIVTMPDITEEIFLKINKADFKEIYESCEKILKQVKNADKISVNSENGTNINFSVKGRIWEGDEAEEGKGFVKNLPTGEVFCAPIEDSANGIIFIENWRNKIKPDSNAWIKIKKGKIVEWSPGAESFIKDQSVENGLIIAEFGIGVNKEHKSLIGNTLHDEKIHGSVHIAFGNNVSFGGKNKSKVHEDLIIMNPKVLVDGKQLKW